VCQTDEGDGCAGNNGGHLVERAHHYHGQETQCAEMGEAQYQWQPIGLEGGSARPQKKRPHRHDSEGSGQEKCGGDAQRRRLVKTQLVHARGLRRCRFHDLDLPVTRTEFDREQSVAAIFKQCDEWTGAEGGGEQQESVGGEPLQCL